MARPLDPAEKLAQSLVPSEAELKALKPSIYRPIIEGMFQIVDKDRQVVPFRMRPAQAILDSLWTRRNIIPKARQEGVSSYVLARFLAKCLTQPNRTCVVVSHEAEATGRLLDRARWTLEHLAEGLKPQLGRNSRGEITFPKTDSTLYIGTAGSRAFGHGDTISDLHWSEASRCDAENLITGLFPAAERGEITVESTGNGRGNWYHRQCLRAKEGKGFKLFFFPWLLDPEYILPFETDGQKALFQMSLKPELREPELAQRGVSLERLAWRRERIEIDLEGSLPKFDEAYPLDFDDCFQSTGYGVFRKINFQPTEEWERVSAAIYRLRGHPFSGHHYVAGVDVSAGVGRDATVAEVFCLETDEQVGEWASRNHEPGLAAAEIADWLRPWGAYVNVERNNHGLAFLQEFVDVYPLELIHRGSHGAPANQYIVSGLNHLGTYVTDSNRGVFIGKLSHQLYQGLIIHGEELRSELTTFVEKDNGRQEADTGCFDDRVMASAHVTACCERAGGLLIPTYSVEELEPDPFSFEGLFGDHGLSDSSRKPLDPLWMYEPR